MATDDTRDARNGTSADDLHDNTGVNGGDEATGSGGADAKPGGASDAAPDVAHDKLRKSIAARLTRLITSEEGLRTVVNAVVPKELIASTLEQVDSTKTEAMAMIGRELRTFLSHLDVGDELAKILTAVSFEIRLEVRFIPNEDGTLRAKVKGGAKPKVNIGSSRKRWSRRGRDETAGDGDEVEDSSADAAAAEATTATSNAAATRAESPGLRSSSPDLRRSSPGRDRPAGATAGSGDRHRSAAVSPEDVAVDAEPERVGLRHLLGRRSLTNLVERVADAAATTARVAAEVAADAAAEVVNEARRGRDERDDMDDY